MNINIKYFLEKINRILFFDKETCSIFQVWRWHIDHAVYSIVFTFLAGIIFKEFGMHYYFYAGFALTILGFILVKIQRRFWNNRTDFYDAFTDLNEYLCGLVVPMLYNGYIIQTVLVFIIIFIIYFLTIKYTSP